MDQPPAPWFYLLNKTVVVEFKQWDWNEVTMTNHPLPRWEKFLFLSMCSWYFDLIIYLILKVTWLSHGMFKSSCNISVEYFPFDIQVITKFQFYFVICKVIFLSTCWIWYSNNETWNCRMFRKSWFGQNDTNFGNVRLEFVQYFAKQDCEMKWASWTYDGYSVSFTMLQCNNVTILQCSFSFSFLQ